MVTNPSLFVDSNYLIALFNDEDLLYPKAEQISQRIDRSREQLVISDYVFSEVVTVLSQRRDRAVVVGAGTFLLSDPRVKMIYVDEYLQQEAWKIFQRTPQKNISFVDCSIVAAMNVEGINQLLTFDGHFKKLKKYHRFKIYD